MSLNRFVMPIHSVPDKVALCYQRYSGVTVKNEVAEKCVYDDFCAWQQLSGRKM